MITETRVTGFRKRVRDQDQADGDDWLGCGARAPSTASRGSQARWRARVAVLARFQRTMSNVHTARLRAPLKARPSALTVCNTSSTTARDLAATAEHEFEAAKLAGGDR